MQNLYEVYHLNQKWIKFDLRLKAYRSLAAMFSPDQIIILSRFGIGGSPNDHLCKTIAKSAKELFF